MHTRIYNGKEQIFCEWRRKWVRLTPEEWVRQHFLHYLAEEMHYPKNLIAVEEMIHYISQDGAKTAKRADAVVYLNDLTPWMVIEFKADTVPLTQKVWDQAAIYNTQLHVPYLVLHNGYHTYIGKQTNSIFLLTDRMPEYGERE